MTDFQKVRALRVLGVTEGISFLILLLIAMPLKYFLQVPEVVTVVGWMHGALFIAYLGVVLLAAPALRYDLRRVLIAWAAAFLPAGTFWLDRQWREHELNLLNTRTAA